MRQTLGILSAVTLGLMGLVALANDTGDPGPAIVFPWGVGLFLASLTPVCSIAASLQWRQFAWLGGLLVAALIGILGLVITFLIPVYPNQMLGGTRLADLFPVVPFLPAGVGVVGLVYSFFMCAPAIPGEKAVQRVTIPHPQAPETRSAHPVA